MSSDEAYTPEEAPQARERASRGEPLSLDAVDLEGASLLDFVPASKEHEPEEVFEGIEWISSVVQMFREYVQRDRSDAARKSSSPIIERAWILWSEYFIDYFMELADWRQDDAILTDSRFPLPPPDVFPPEGKGQHNPVWADYLARYIGEARGWGAAEIEEDLAQQRSPRDLSKLRAAVRVRRNEAKADIAPEVQRIHDLTQ
jgi:hypothetical protein